MYVRACAYVCAFACVCACACIRVCMYVCVFARAYVYMCVHERVYVCVYERVRVMYVYMYVRVCTVSACVFVWAREGGGGEHPICTDTRRVIKI